MTSRDLNASLIDDLWLDMSKARDRRMAGREDRLLDNSHRYRDALMQQRTVRAIRNAGFEPSVTHRSASPSSPSDRKRLSYAIRSAMTTKERNAAAAPLAFISGDPKHVKPGRRIPMRASVIRNDLDLSRCRSFTRGSDLRRRITDEAMRRISRILQDGNIYLWPRTLNLKDDGWRVKELGKIRRWIERSKRTKSPQSLALQIIGHGHAWSLVIERDFETDTLVSILLDYSDHARTKLIESLVNAFKDTRAWGDTIHLDLDEVVINTEGTCYPQSMVLLGLYAKLRRTHSWYKSFERVRARLQRLSPSEWNKRVSDWWNTYSERVESDMLESATEGATSS